MAAILFRPQCVNIYSCVTLKYLSVKCLVNANKDSGPESP